MNDERRQHKAQLTRALIVVMVVGSLNGCTGYRLGSMVPPGIRSVHIPTFTNETGEPLVETIATQEAIREFQRDGTLRIAQADRADALLQVSVIGMQLVPVRFRSDEAETTREYKLLLKAEITFTPRATQKAMIKNKQVEGEYVFTPSGDLTASQRQALPSACRDLAHDIVEAIVEYWPDN